MIKKRHKKHNESGRSMIEMLGVLALLILLTLGGIKVFGLLYANVVSKAVTDSVMTEASIRRHEHMKRMPDGPNIVETPGPYGYKLHVEDGTTGDLANTFWVSLSLVESFYRKPICDSLLSRAGAFLQAQTEYQERNDSEHWLGMIEFVVDGKIVQECSDQVEEARYLFAKSGTNIGDINICFGTCCQLCPEGGVCRDGEITCEPGYKKVGGGPCGGGTCVKCTGRECCGPSCTDPECPPGTKPTDNNDACPCCTVGDDGEECGCPEGLRPNRECGCGCNDDEDCPEGEHCDTETGICSCTKKSCGDGERWNEKLCKCQSCGGGGCPCEEDSDCPRGWKCPDTEPKVCQPTECEKDEDCKFGMICDPIYKICVSITCEMDTDCPGNMICNPETKICECPKGAEPNEEEEKCDCQENEYISVDGKECLLCTSDATAAKGDNVCTCTDETIVWNRERNSCSARECALVPAQNISDWEEVERFCSGGGLISSAILWSRKLVCSLNRLESIREMIMRSHEQTCSAPGSPVQPQGSDEWWVPTTPKFGVSFATCVCPSLDTLEAGQAGGIPDNVLVQAVHEACEYYNLRGGVCDWTFSNRRHSEFGEAINGAKYTVEEFVEQVGMCGNCLGSCDCGRNAVCHAHYCHCENGWRLKSSGDCQIADPCEAACPDGQVATGEGNCVKCLNGDCSEHIETIRDVPHSYVNTINGRLDCNKKTQEKCMPDPCRAGQCLCPIETSNNCPEGTTRIGLECCEPDQIIEGEHSLTCCKGTIYTNMNNQQDCCDKTVFTNANGQQECCDGVVFTNEDHQQECCPSDMQYKDGVCGTPDCGTLVWNPETLECDCPVDVNGHKGDAINLAPPGDEPSYVCCWGKYMLVGSGDRLEYNTEVTYLCGCNSEHTSDSDGCCESDGWWHISLDNGWHTWPSLCNACPNNWRLISTGQDDEKACCTEDYRLITDWANFPGPGVDYSPDGVLQQYLSSFEQSELCCPSGTTGYRDEDGNDVVCCPNGTEGVQADGHVVCCEVDEYGNLTGNGPDGPTGVCCEIANGIWNDGAQKCCLLSGGYTMDNRWDPCACGCLDPVTAPDGNIDHPVSMEENCTVCCSTLPEYPGFEVQGSSYWQNRQCGCPTAENGETGHMEEGAQGFKCCGDRKNLLWNPDTRAYDEYSSDSTSYCGCPYAYEYDSGSKGTYQVYACCYEGFAYTEWEEDYLDVDPYGCGYCPLNQETTNGYYCCANGYRAEEGTLASREGTCSGNSAGVYPYCTLDPMSCDSCPDGTTSSQSGYTCCLDGNPGYDADGNYNPDCGCPGGTTHASGSNGDVCCLDGNPGYDATYNLDPTCGCPSGYTLTENVCCDDAQHAYDISGNLNPACGCPDGFEKRNGVCCSLAEPGKNVTGQSVMACCPDENKVCARSGNRSDKCVCNIGKPNTACSPYACIACASNETAQCSSQVYSTQGAKKPCICVNNSTQNGVCSSSGECIVCDKPLSGQCITEGCVCYNYSTQNVGCNSWAGGCTVCDKPKTVDARNRRCLDP